MVGPAEFVWVNLPSVLFVVVHEIRIVKANYLLAWYSTWCYSALTLRRHISTIFIQKSAYFYRVTVAIVQLYVPYTRDPLWIKISVSWHSNLSLVRTLNLPFVNRLSFSLWQISFNRRSYLYIFIGLWLYISVCEATSLIILLFNVWMLLGDETTLSTATNCT